MLKKLIIVLLCINSYKTLGESKKPRNIQNKASISLSESFSDNYLSVEKEKIFIKDKPIYLKYTILSEKDLQSFKSLLHDNKNIQFVPNNNFEQLNRVNNDNIHIARLRKLMENIELKDYYFYSEPIKEVTILEEKINNKLRELYIQQIKSKKSP